MTEGLLVPSVHTAEDNCGWSFWMKRSAYTNSPHIPPAEHQQVTRPTRKYDTGGRAMCVCVVCGKLTNFAVQDLLLLLPEVGWESGGRKQRKEINTECSRSSKDNIVKNTLHATVCSGMYSLCNSCTYNLCPFFTDSVFQHYKAFTEKGYCSKCC